MITLDVVTAVCGMLLLSLTVVFIAWLYEQRRVKKSGWDARSSAYLQQCPYCAAVFMDYQERIIVECPTCGSYIEEQKGDALYEKKKQ
jgi:uncharacterized C2H2 Zn-finger protein